jgi:hypothetical protein
MSIQIQTVTCRPDMVATGPMFNSFRPAQSLGGTYQYSDQIAWSKGSHTIRAGFEYERVHYFSRPGAIGGFWFLLMTFVGGRKSIFYTTKETVPKES